MEQWEQQLAVNTIPKAHTFPTLATSRGAFSRTKMIPEMLPHFFSVSTLSSASSDSFQPFPAPVFLCSSASTLHCFCSCSCWSSSTSSSSLSSCFLFRPFAGYRLVIVKSCGEGKTRLSESNSKPHRSPK